VAEKGTPSGDGTAAGRPATTACRVAAIGLSAAVGALEEGWAVNRRRQCNRKAAAMQPLGGGGLRGAPQVVAVGAVDGPEDVLYHQAPVFGAGPQDDGGHVEDGPEDPVLAVA